MTRVGSLTIQFDTRIPAVYVYLRDPDGFRSAKSKEVANGVVVDLDAAGRLIGVEMLGPGSLQVVFQKVIPKYHAAGLKQLENRRRIIEEVLSGAV